MTEERVAIEPPRPSGSVSYEFVKRCADILVSSVLLIVFAIPLAVISLAVWLTSAGPVLYRQTRVGRGDRPFKVFKFRTMYADADRCGPLITSSDDDRVTPVGRFLRSSKLDELPQFINVLLGDMSVVGPRPQVPRFVRHFAPADRAVVLSVRPGITGPTQLKFRCEEQMLEGHEDKEQFYIENLLPVKCRMDVQYVFSRSVRQDIQVFCETAAAVVGGVVRRARRQPAEVAVVRETRPRHPQATEREVWDGEPAALFSARQHEEDDVREVAVVGAGVNGGA